MPFWERANVVIWTTNLLALLVLFLSRPATSPEVVHDPHCSGVIMDIVYGLPSDDVEFIRHETLVDGRVYSRWRHREIEYFGGG